MVWGLLLRWEKTKAFFGFNNKQSGILSQAETFHDGIKAIVFERPIKQATSGKSLMPHGTYIYIYISKKSTFK